MTAAQNDFDERVTEIEEYFNFIARLDADQLDDTKIEMRVTRTGETAFGATELGNLVKTFRASAILLLYNLMESTVSNAVESVFDELASNGIEFDECRRELREVVLSNLKQNMSDSLVGELRKISTDIISKTFIKKKEVSGNVDAKTIKKLVKRYGIEQPRADGDDLLTVKSHRNDLAHGSKSFAEVGRSFATADLLRLKTKVVAYLRVMLSNVDIYLQKKAYREFPNATQRQSS